MKKYAKIINEETKVCEVGLGTNSKFYQSIGMSEMDVEQAWDGAWYVVGHTPEEPKKTIKEQNEDIRAIRAARYQSEVDILMAEYNRKKLFDLFSTEEEETLKEQILTKVAEIKEQNPYQQNEITGETDNV